MELIEFEHSFIRKPFFKVLISAFSAPLTLLKLAFIGLDSKNDQFSLAMHVTWIELPFEAHRFVLKFASSVHNIVRKLAHIISSISPLYRALTMLFALQKRSLKFKVILNYLHTLAFGLVLHPKAFYASLVRVYESALSFSFSTYEVSLIASSIILNHSPVPIRLISYKMSIVINSVWINTFSIAPRHALFYLSFV